MQTSLLDLRSLLQNGIILLDIPANELPTISRKIFEKFNLKKNSISFLDTIVQSLIDSEYFHDSNYAQKLVWILGLPHFHHHEKRSVTKTASSLSLSKQGLHPSPSFVINNLIRHGLIIIVGLISLVFFFFSRR